MEKEALTLESLSLAIAAKNNDGFVIVQVKRLPILLERRLGHDPDQGVFYVHFESDEIGLIDYQMAAILEPVGAKVKAIVNHDPFDISPGFIDEYMDMVKPPML